MEVVSSSPTKISVSFFSVPNPTVLDFELSGKEEDLSPLFSGNFWSAMVWQDSVSVMCDYIRHHKEEFENKSVVELGCGLGIPGFVSGFVGNARSVFLSDREEDLYLLTRAMQINKATIPLKFQTVAYDWQLECPNLLRQNPCDIILAVECVSADAYGQESLPWLIGAIQSLKNPTRNVILFLCSCRREESDGLNLVLTMLKEEGIARDVKLVVVEGRVELYRIVCS